MAKLFRVSNRQDQGELIASSLGINDKYENPDDELKRKGLIEVFINLLRFCHEHCFNAEKISTLMSILYLTHLKMTEPPLPSIREGFNEFKSMLLKHSVERPPFSISVFTPKDVSIIVAYITDTYFRQWRLYQFVYGQAVDLNLTEEKEKEENEDLNRSAEITPLDKEDELKEDEDDAGEEIPKDFTPEEEEEYNKLLKEYSLEVQELYESRSEALQSSFTERLSKLASRSEDVVPEEEAKKEEVKA
eukprot:CAMPEP_0184482386 /NCGR_PEP_ID=MMETSP0113_2-20130426/3940_1 /TAXON_ID=91329 /ORGANISM="Norrisiella sphaerica, Strain BC52" /LENGTH=246 /DNA_ID=CAMNT_0026862081 /DNA_START=35 /DNA_END=775 /DNA_ORIENTATION=-